MVDENYLKKVHERKGGEKSETVKWDTPGKEFCGEEKKTGLEPEEN